MARPFVKNLARQVMKQQKTRGDVPGLVMAAARRVLQNKAQPSDETTLVNHTGIRRSGATAVKKAQRGIRSAFQPLVQIQADAEQIADVGARGGDTGPATVRFLANVSNNLDNLLKTKFVKQTAEKVASTISKTKVGQALGIESSAAGLRFLRSAGRMLRFGGAIGIAGAAAIAGIVRYDRMTNRLGRLQNDIQKSFASQNLSGSARQRVLSRISAEVGRNASSFDKSNELFGLGAAVTEKIKKESEMTATDIARVRGSEYALESLLENAPQVLAEGARRRGLQIGELTERQRSQILDEGIEEAFDFENAKTKQMFQDRARAVFEGRTRVDENGNVIGPGISEGDTFARFGKDAQNFVRDLIPIIASNQQVIDEMANQFFLAHRKKMVEQLLNEDNRRTELQRNRFALKPQEEIRNIRMMTDITSGSYTSYRSRHKAWAND